MSDGFVADASVAIGWVHPGQSTPQTQRLLQAIYDGAHVEVPALWPLEISNALLVLTRRKKLIESERLAALAALQKVSVKIDHEMSALAFTKLSAIAAEHQLSVYDAAYFELAQRRKLPLACKDGALLEAAKRARLNSSSGLSAVPGSFDVVYDGNGNVMGLVDVSNGTVVARYEYGPFGELIRASGPMAKNNPFRFSTKYQDDEFATIKEWRLMLWKDR